MVLNRVNSTYTLDVWTETPNPIADKIIAACGQAGVSLAASGVDSGRAFVRFRCGDDETAVETAHTILAGIAEVPVLHTGYGVNQRVVSMA